MKTSIIADDAVVLTPDNFDEFFTPWCGHCQKLAPDYERLASSFKKTDTVLIAKVDCTEYYDLCAKYDVTGYPTIHWFPKGSMQPRKYEGIRTADDLADFVNAEAGKRSRPEVLAQRAIQDGWLWENNA